MQQQPQGAVHPFRRSRDFGQSHTAAGSPGGQGGGGAGARYPGRINGTTFTRPGKPPVTVTARSDGDASSAGDIAAAAASPVTDAQPAEAAASGEGESPPLPDWVRNAAINGCWPLALAKRTFATPAAFYVYCRELLADTPVRTDLPQRDARLVIAALRRAATAGGDLGSQLVPAAAVARSGVVATPQAGASADGAGSAPGGGDKVVLWAVNAEETDDESSVNRSFLVFVRPAGQQANTGGVSETAPGSGGEQGAVTFALDALVKGLIAETERSAKQRLTPGAVGGAAAGAAPGCASKLQTAKSGDGSAALMAAAGTDAVLEASPMVLRWPRARPGSGELTGWATQVPDALVSMHNRESDMAEGQQHHQLGRRGHHRGTSRGHSRRRGQGGSGESESMIA